MIDDRETKYKLNDIDNKLSQIEKKQHTIYKWVLFMGILNIIFIVIYIIIIIIDVVSVINH